MHFRSITYATVLKAAKKLVYDANFCLPDDVLDALRIVEYKETGLQHSIMHKITENAFIAKNEELPLCQDTGIGVFFVTLGSCVLIENGTLTNALEQAVREIYKDYYLRASVVKSPLERINTGDNTPVIIHIDMIPGDDLTIAYLPKGAGSENVSALKMFPPTLERHEIVRFVAETVHHAGPNPCPPVIVGVGIGGTFELAPKMAKKALLRTIGQRHSDREIAEFEVQLLHAVNETGVGIQGLGGDVTALDVFVETYACHIASLPVAVNINCHAARHASVTL